MSQFEVIRLIGEILGILAIVAGGVWYIVRQIWHVLTAVEHLTEKVTGLDDHQKEMNGSVGTHFKEDERQFSSINNRLGNIEGRLGLPPHEDQI